MAPRELSPLQHEPSDFLATGQQVFGTLQREVDRLFDDFGRGFGRLSATSFPRLDVVETNSEIQLTAELPGLEEKDVDVSLADGALTISGEKKSEIERKDKTSWISERTYGAFQRRVNLPAGVEAKDISAAMAKGVLTITVRKPEAARPEKIGIKNLS